MTETSGRNTQTLYGVITQTSRDRDPSILTMIIPLAPEGEVDTISFQSQPEQQSQAHESSEGERRALQLIEEYDDDITIDEYDFDDEIRIQQQPPQPDNLNKLMISNNIVKK